MSSSSDSSDAEDDYEVDFNTLDWKFFSADEQDGSLRLQFQDAVKKHSDLEWTTLHKFTSAYRNLHTQALEKMVCCTQAIEKCGIFSPNESLDDLSTTSIPYLSANYYLADILEQTTIDPDVSSVESRCETLQFACRKYLEFLSLVDDYGLITNPQHRNIVNLSFPEGIQGKFNLTEIVENSYNYSRQSRLTQDRALQKMRGSLHKQSRLLTAGMLGDEERLRKALISLVSYHAELAFGALRDSAHELVMLSRISQRFSLVPLQERNIPFVPTSKVIEHLKKLNAFQGPTFDEVRDERLNQMKNDSNASRLDSTRVNSLSSMGQPGRLVGPDGKVQQPFTILPSSVASTMSRDEIRRNAFGTGQKLPTISVDELVKKELANMVETKPKPTSEIDEDADAVVDAETMKARLWDEYTESVAKGSGNTLNLG